MDAELEAKMKREHFEKYAALAERLGVDALRKLLPVPRERIEAALASGDEHLNTIPLTLWDKAVGVDSTQVYKPMDWPASDLMRTVRFEPWSKVKSLSLSDRVCVLKHVATHCLPNDEVAR